MHVQQAVVRGAIAVLQVADRIDQRRRDELDPLAFFVDLIGDARHGPVHPKHDGEVDCEGCRLRAARLRVCRSDRVRNLPLQRRRGAADHAGCGVERETSGQRGANRVGDSPLGLEQLRRVDRLLLILVQRAAAEAVRAEAHARADDLDLDRVGAAPALWIPADVLDSVQRGRGRELRLASKARFAAAVAQAEAVIRPRHHVTVTDALPEDARADQAALCLVWAQRRRRVADLPPNLYLTQVDISRNLGLLRLCLLRCALILLPGDCARREQTDHARGQQAREQQGRAHARRITARHSVRRRRDSMSLPSTTSRPSQPLASHAPLPSNPHRSALLRRRLRLSLGLAQGVWGVRRRRGWRGSQRERDVLTFAAALRRGDVHFGRRLIVVRQAHRGCARLGGHGVAVACIHCHADRSVRLVGTVVVGRRSLHSTAAGAGEQSVVPGGHAGFPFCVEIKLTVSVLAGAGSAVTGTWAA